MGTYTYEWICQQIVQKTYDAIIFADRDGIIRLWNLGAEVMFGYRAGEALGQTLDLIIPERMQERHWEGYREVIKTGSTRYAWELLAVPAIRKDGTHFPIEFTIVLLHDRGGELLGAAAIIRDVTARLQKEKAPEEHSTTLEIKVENYPKDLKYTGEHWWVRIEDGKARLGITQRIADFLSLVTNVELPEVGDKIKINDTIGIIESQKTTVDLSSPLSGKVLEVNKSLIRDPLPLVYDPYGEGWMIVIELLNLKEIDGLIDMDEYLKVVEWEKSIQKGVGRI
ncbi:MAG TPA: PAS domain S-box protein [Thermodesulfobacteriota bacterium]|nr:PAS domain S-box protein [Thermodesulfobacteriota bacterium]